MDPVTNPQIQVEQNEMLHEYLSKFSEPCPSCEYNLHGLQDSRCPECGQELVLRVGLATPNLVAFIVGLVGLASATGFSGLLLVYFGYHIIQSTYPWEFVGIVLVVEFICSGVLTIVWSRANRWLRRRSRRSRWTLALLCWILPVLSLIVFVTALEM